MSKDRNTRPGMFWGWWIVLVQGILGGLGHGFYGRAFSALFKPIASELGLSRAVTSVAAGIGRLEGGLEAPLTGWLVDKFGPRWVIFIGTCIICIGLALMTFVTSLWAFYLVWGFIIGIGVNLALTLAMTKTLTNWFVRKRGLALGIQFVLTGMGGVIVLPIAIWLITAQDWRMTCLIWAGLMCLGLPFVLFIIKQKRPEYYGLLPDGARVESLSEVDTKNMVDRGVEYASEFQETEFTLRQAIRTPAYWLIVIVWSCQTIVFGGFIIHCIPFLTDMGIDLTVAGGMMAMMGFFALPSRFLSGFIIDRMKKEHLRFVLAGAFLLVAIGISAFLLNQSISIVYVFLILYGFGSGAFLPLIIAIRGRYFGRKAYGSISGSSTLLMSPASLLAPVYAGWIYDTTGSYTTAFIVFAALAFFAALLTCLLFPPKPPTQITDINKFL